MGGPGASFMFRTYSQPRWVVSSYFYNCWIGKSSFYQEGWGFSGEPSINFPSRTPVFADGVVWGSTPCECLPATDLALGLLTGAASSGMTLITIPRHGSRPRPVPRNHRPQDRLPGAINASFYDGHAEQVPLERLWQLYWHNNYEPPTKRPGLP